MGAKCLYHCNKCNYSAHISGGHDVGMSVKTNTFLCRRCEEVVDIVIEYLDSETVHKSGVNNCPKCNSDKNIEEWNNKKRPCPKCNGTMIIPTDTIRTLWD